MTDPEIDPNALYARALELERRISRAEKWRPFAASPDVHTISLEHVTQTAHRIPNHEGGTGKCARLHGHSYKFVVTLTSHDLDPNGFVLDFGAIKRKLDEWDHRMLLWEHDPLLAAGRPDGGDLFEMTDEASGIIRLPFVPTAENMAQHLAEYFEGAYESVVLAVIEVHETEKTCARAERRAA